MYVVCASLAASHALQWDSLYKRPRDVGMRGGYGDEGGSGYFMEGGGRKKVNANSLPLR